MEDSLIKRKISVADYFKMQEAGIFRESERLELIKGEIFEMSLIGALHAAIVDRISNLLIHHFYQKAIVRVQNPIQATDSSMPQPDIVLIKPNPKYTKIHPTANDVLLLIEVAETSLAFDREVKLPVYAAAGIEEYWIVNLDQWQIEVYRTPFEDTYRHRTIFRQGEVLSIQELPKDISIIDLLGQREA